MNILFPIIAAVIGISAGLGFASAQKKSMRSDIEAKASSLVGRAKRESDEILSIGTEETVKRRSKIQNLSKEFEERTKIIEERIVIKEESMEKRKKREEDKIALFKQIRQEARDLHAKTEETKQKESEHLLDKSKLDKESVLEQIKKNLDGEFSDMGANFSVKIQSQAKDLAQKISTNTLKAAMQRYTGPSSVVPLERTVKIPRDTVKGRIVGKDGKNIQYFEEKFGVNVIIDDQPGYITVANYNLVKQETARLALEKLVKERDINEDVIDKAQVVAIKDMDDVLLAIGSKAAKIIGLENPDPELLKLVGRLKYRTSYGQNILYHSLEIAYLAEMLASEIGADQKTARLGGFFHDLGKAIDQETGGSHDQLSKEILERFGFSWEVVHAAWTHHDAIPIETVEAQLVKAADALSGGRPGARTESAESYFERIQALEKIATSHAQVKKAYAISAGREIRTFVDEHKVKDDDLKVIATSLAKEISQNVGFPGKIKVNVIRIIEAVDYTGKV